MFNDDKVEKIVSVVFTSLDKLLVSYFELRTAFLFLEKALSKVDETDLSRAINEMKAALNRK